LDATVRKPAEAEQFRIQTLAEARQFQLQTEATGEAEAIRLRGSGEADAARAQGLATAEVTRQVGLAEAEATLKKADAWRNYTQAAVIQQVLDALPELATAIASPLAKTERIVVISSGGENGSGAGSSKVTQDVTNILAQLPTLIESLTGVDLMKAIQELPGLRDGRREADANGSPPVEPGEKTNSVEQAAARED
jgi:flotillin